MQSCWEEQESRPAFTQILNTLDILLAKTADYVDLTGFRTDVEDKQDHGSKPTGEFTLQSHVPAEPNDYSIADV